MCETDSLSWRRKNKIFQDGGDKRENKSEPLILFSLFINNVIEYLVSLIWPILFIAGQIRASQIRVEKFGQIKKYLPPNFCH